MNAARLMLTSVTVLALVMPAARGDAKSEPQSRPAEAQAPGVPPIGRLLGVRVGQDAIDKLERLYGRGVPCLGGRPRGGRMWKDGRSRWAVYADGFEGRGRIIETVVVGDPQAVIFPAEGLNPRSRPKRLRATIPRKELLFGSLRPGMSSAAAREAVASKGWPCATERGGLVIRMEGVSRIEKNVRVSHWEATLRFVNDRLIQVTVRCYA